MTIRNPETGFVTRAIVHEWQADQQVALLAEWRSPCVVEVSEIVGVGTWATGSLQ